MNDSRVSLGKAQTELFQTVLTLAHQVSECLAAAW